MTLIKFYSRKEEYGWLSNFWRASETVNGVTYPTNENFYQSQKATDPETAQWIAAAPRPYLAMKAGRALRAYELKPNWDSIKLGIMRFGLEAKFTQNKDLAEKLVATGNAVLAEDSPTDMYWGRLGSNMLGKLLMSLRDRLVHQGWLDSTFA